MGRIEELVRQRKWANGKMLQYNSKVFKKFQELEQATFCDGELPKKYKELIAVGISVVTNCESCMQWHISEAAKDGATEKEIVEAIEVAFEMGIGPATVNGRFALEVLEGLFPKGA
ncbi:MAG: carboxymuconolactone decarboxylase family protein [Candidatus Latescibacterota bacterium]|jgi:AhpD family alkylhydroperoxidase|nr:MAG: carboxymuconolactone decarboxylase family protein [Candidatus Latescibacterota bacterium]